MIIFICRKASRLEILHDSVKGAMSIVPGSNHHYVFLLLVFLGMSS